MELKTKYGFGTHALRKYSVAEAVERELCQNSYDSGTIETASHNITAMQRYMGHLIAHLYEKKVFTDEDVLAMLPSHEKADEA